MCKSNNQIVGKSCLQELTKQLRLKSFTVGLHQRYAECLQLRLKYIVSVLTKWAYETDRLVSVTAATVMLIIWRELVDS